MDEHIELLDAAGKRTGKACLKSEAHKKGYFHASVHIWFYTQKAEILLQKRQCNKETFPNLWDVSVAGHISFGEDPLTAAKREISEEIGLEIKPEQLTSLGTNTHKHLHTNHFTDYELHHIYCCLLQTPIQDLIVQEEEVAEVKLLNIDQFISELANPKTKGLYVPHGDPYYKKVINEIKKQI